MHLLALRLGRRMLFLEVLAAAILTGAAPQDARAWFTHCWGPGYSYYYFGGAHNWRGILDLSNGQCWTLTMADIDGSRMLPPAHFTYMVEDWTTEGDRTYGIDVLLDANGPGGHRFRCIDTDGAVRSEHLLPAGASCDTFGLQLVIAQGADRRWLVVPSFRLLDGSWTLFSGGPWITAEAFDMHYAFLLNRNDGPPESWLCVNSPLAEPSTATSAPTRTWGGLKARYR